jgi:hypothetical protein
VRGGGDHCGQAFCVVAILKAADAAVDGGFRRDAA